MTFVQTTYQRTGKSNYVENRGKPLLPFPSNYSSSLCGNFANRRQPILQPTHSISNPSMSRTSSNFVQQNCVSSSESSFLSQSKSSHSQSSGNTSQIARLPLKQSKSQEERIFFPHNLKQEVMRLQQRRHNLDQEISENMSQLSLDDSEVIYTHHDDSVGLDSTFSQLLLNDLEFRMKQPDFIKMQKHRKTLPTYKEQERILKMIENNQVVVLGGETGCGKTTQIPQYILDSYILAERGFECRIVCTQPRRISAIGVAERVAAERCVPCGEENDIGYHIRLERKKPRNYGSILYCTTGIVLLQLQKNPYLSGISHIIVDEVHERDLLSDFFLMNLRDILNKNKTIRVILMSATVNAKVFSSYFGDCPVIEVPGRTFPVETFYLEDVIQITGNVKQTKIPSKKKNSTYEKEKHLYLSTIASKYSASTIRIVRNWNEDTINFELIIELLKYITSDKKPLQSSSKKMEGSILIFLPGMKEIQALFQKIQNSLPNIRNFKVIPLHSLTSSKYQRQVLETMPNGLRKIILSTNIAETSITIDDCTVVIDCGKLKLKDFDPVTNIHILQPQWIALSNAKQRRGRARRTQPGVCYHLFTSFKESKLEEFQLPEIQRCNLAELILNIKILKKGNVREYFQKAINPPKPGAVEMAFIVLRELNALTISEDLTPLGYLLAKLPVDVHIGKMLLLSAIFSCLDPITTIAACLSFKDPFQFAVFNDDKRKLESQKYTLSEDTQSDHLLFVKIMQLWKDVEEDSDESKSFCKENFLIPGTLRMLNQLKQQYAKYLKQFNLIGSDDPADKSYNVNSDNNALIRAILCAALYPNIVKVCSRKSSESMLLHKPLLRATTKHGNTVYIHPKSINAFEDCITTGWLCYYLKMRSTKVYIHDTTQINPQCMLLFGSQVKRNYVRRVLYLTVDNWINFSMNSMELDLIMCLRRQFNNIFKRKIIHPSITDWHENSEEIQILQGVINFIS